MPSMSDGYGPATYGEHIAEVYDRWAGVPTDTDATVAFLAALAGGGPALELGIGTGRVALPLAARGVEVRGVDASPAMVARLRAKPGGDAIPVHLGDFADVGAAGVGAPGPLALVYVVFNTLFALLDQDAQVRCFAGVAARLRPGGRFVVEAFVPDLGRFDRGQRTSVIDLDAGMVLLDASVHDPVTQRVRAQHAVVGERGIKLYPVQLRYAWPAELDLMARLAGLALEARHGGWTGEPFTAASGRHVSVYRKPDP
jgi:SAM-dependent methyltransferase